MSNNWDSDPDEDDDSPEDDYPDEDYPDDDDAETLTLPCPACGCDVYEDAVRCPICGEYVTRGSRTWEGRPAWWIMLGMLGIIAVMLALIIIV